MTVSIGVDDPSLRRTDFFRTLNEQRNLSQSPNLWTALSGLRTRQSPRTFYDTLCPAAFFPCDDHGQKHSF